MAENEMPFSIIINTPRSDGSTTQHVWLITERYAKQVADRLGPPHAVMIMPSGAASAAGEAAMGKGAQMYTTMDETGGEV